ncbi:MAG TPA: AcrB/AcrD/AcrF family protein, partial [Allosphingosinicella sp.]
PVAGLIGYATMLWRLRLEPARLMPWAALAAPALVAALLLLWQMRAGAAAQLLAVPGVTALALILIPAIRARGGMLARVFGTVLAFLLISGLGAQWLSVQFQKPDGKAMNAVNLANRRCPTLAALRPIALQPKGYVLTFADLGPRLITVTHHDAVAGPYHRNVQAILDVQHAFRGSADAAHAIVARRGIDYVLICPNLSESTIYRTQAPKGFYVQLANGQVPAWLTPVALPADSPYRMWRVVKP